MKGELHRRLERLDWSRAVADVQPFLATAAEVEQLTLDSVQRLL
jgi:hypothetical protein